MKRKNQLKNKHMGGGGQSSAVYFTLEGSENVKSISIDIETFSSVSLQKSGVYRYAESEDFEILLFGYSVDGCKVKVVDLCMGEKIPDEIINALTDDSVIKWAFNAQFERVCLSRYLRDNGVSLGGYCLDPVS